ncbi:Choline-sulfatase [Planctomycetes bacterium MalM25]|nr:Choline-sulfatase [Planctomycetes bacterium MalM25]
MNLLDQLVMAPRLALALTLWTPLACGGLSSIAHGADRPNVILCMADDLGWGDTGYNGHPVLRTPHLDRMAEEGIRFDRFYAGAPVCSPTRGSCLTGRHPSRYGIPSANSGRLKSEEVTLAEVMKQHGYATGHFGKWHLGTLTAEIKESNRARPGNAKDYAPPWDHGFDVCFSTEAKTPTYWRAGSYEDYGTHYWTGPGEMVPADAIQGDDSKLIMDRAVTFLRDVASRDEPFFLVIWFHAPHLPVVSAPPYTDGYTDHQDYYGCITALDEQMGRLRGELKKLGVAEHTMLAFTSDNGPEGKPSAPGRTAGLRGRKRSLYEGGVRVPGLFVWPEMAPGPQTLETPCSTSDYFPTVLDAIGYQLPEAQARPYDGVSLLPLLRGETETRPRPIGFAHKQQVALIDNRYKLYRGTPASAYQLFDLTEDPSEANDLSTEHPEVIKSMGTTLEAWRASCKRSNRGEDY